MQQALCNLKHCRNLGLAFGNSVSIAVGFPRHACDCSSHIQGTLCNQLFPYKQKHFHPKNQRQSLYGCSPSFSAGWAEHCEVEAFHGASPCGQHLEMPGPILGLSTVPPCLAKPPAPSSASSAHSKAQRQHLADQMPAEHLETNPKAVLMASARETIIPRPRSISCAPALCRVPEAAAACWLCSTGGARCGVTGCRFTNPFLHPRWL